jgi:hypothetical protein
VHNGFSLQIAEMEPLHAPSGNVSQVHLRQFNIRKNERKRKNVGGNVEAMSFWECGSLLELSVQTDARPGGNPALRGFRRFVGFRFWSAEACFCGFQQVPKNQYQQVLPLDSKIISFLAFCRGKPPEDILQPLFSSDSQM